MSNLAVDASACPAGGECCASDADAEHQLYSGDNLDDRSHGATLFRSNRSPTAASDLAQSLEIPPDWNGTRVKKSIGSIAEKPWMRCRSEGPRPLLIRA